MKKDLCKIDNQGVYRQFPGITVISPINKGDLVFWKELHDFIDKCDLIRKCFAPLPYESYHMTTLNLYTQEDDGHDDWKGFIEKQLPFFQRLHSALISKAFKPKININTLVVSDTIQLYLQLPTAQENKVITIADEFAVQQKIPKVFHITLAYRFKDSDETSNENIKQTIATQLDKQFATRANSFYLEPATLCFFNDMTAFKPWNAKADPFK